MVAVELLTQLFQEDPPFDEEPRQTEEEYHTYAPVESHATLCHPKVEPELPPMVNLPVIWLSVGAAVGTGVGTREGANVGIELGFAVDGTAVGLGVGTELGFAVDGTGVGPKKNKVKSKL